MSLTGVEAVFAPEELANLRTKLAAFRRDEQAAIEAGDTDRAVELRRRRVVECGLAWGASDDLRRLMGLHGALVVAAEHLPVEALDVVERAFRPAGVEPAPSRRRRRRK